MALLEQRKDLYEATKRNHPERWSGKTRDWSYLNIVMLNPGNVESSCVQEEKSVKQQAA